jgi:small-conductance mechanosensitive channel
MAQGDFMSAEMLRTNESRLGEAIRRFVYFAAFGSIIGVGIIWCLSRLPAVREDNLPLAFIYDLAALIAILVVSAFAGIPGAKILLIFLTSFLDSYTDRVRGAIHEYSRQSKWPGRRFLDVLRYTKLASLRREFIFLGLDTHLRVPHNSDAAAIERISSILSVLQTEVAARGQKELSATAGEARALLRSLIYLSRLRLAIVWLCYMALPAAIAYLCAITLEGRTLLRVFLVPDISHVVLSLILITAVPLATYFVGQMLFFLTWNLGKRTVTQLDDVLLLVFSWIVGGMVGIVALFYSLLLFRRWPVATQGAARAFFYLFIPMKHSEIMKHSGDSGGQVGDFFFGLGRGSFFVLRTAIILSLTSLLIVLLRAICNRVLREVAARTKQKYDDMMVELVRIFGTFILAALGIGWVFMVFITEYGTGTGTVEGAGPLMPYALLVAVAGGILGIGSRDMLENFFAGVSMQIDRPFEPSERVVLEDGSVCEVRSVGMRSTHFYNILENTDLYVPNTKLAQQTVSNLSRPDREYRRSLKVFVKEDNNDSLLWAEGLMLFAAFSVEGIDVPTIVDEQYELSMFHKNRRGIAAEFFKLQEHYDEAASAAIKFHGQLIPVGELVRDKCRELSLLIRTIHKDREQFWDIDLGRPVRDLFNKNLKEKAEQAHEISYRLYELAMCFWTLAASYPALRADLEHLSLELFRAPSIKSNHRITEEGVSIWEVDLMVYAQLTEQSDEILHNLNIFIQQLLATFSLLPSGTGNGRQTKPKPTTEEGFKTSIDSVADHHGG